MTIVAVTAECEHWYQIHHYCKQKERFFITSLCNIEDFARAIREHWGIENALHRRLDVGFREDACRIRKDHSGENFATIRKKTMNFLRKKDETQLSLRGKRHRCAYDDEYLLRVLSGV